MSQNWLTPDWEPGLALPSLPIQHFLEIQTKVLFLDVDGTILSGKEINIHQSVREWVTESKKHLQVHLLSNNPSVNRIGSVANQLGLTFTCGAAKPRKKALMKTLEELNTNPSEAAIIGDRLFTDILVGKRIGLYTVLVKPLLQNGYPRENCKVQSLEKKVAGLIGGVVQ